MTLNTIEIKKCIAEKVAESRKIVDVAEVENREMSPEEKASFDQNLADVADLKARIEKLEKLEDAEQDVATVEENSRSRVRSLNRQEQRNEQREDHSPVASKEYRKAFVDFLRTGDQGEFRSLTVGTLNKGGYLVTPRQVAEGVYHALDTNVFMRKLATVHKVRDAVALGIRKITARADDADFRTEIQEDNLADMTFGLRELTPKRLSKTIKVSLHLLETSTDAESIIINEMVKANDRPEEKAYIIGSGSGEPLGLFTPSVDGIDTSRDVVAGSTTLPTVAGLNAMRFKLDPNALKSPNCRWVMHPDVLAKIAGLADTAGVPLWQRDLQGAAPDRLMGIPVETSVYAPNTFTTGQYIAVLGDLSGYAIGETAELSVQRLNELFITSDQIGFRTRRYVDGAPINIEGFVRGKLA